MYQELIKKIKSGKIKTSQQLENEKIAFAKNHMLLKIPKNAEIIAECNDKKIIKFLQMKPTRTQSGVANIAVMWMPAKAGIKKDELRSSYASCPGKCIYCPQKDNVPKSYTGTEPTTMRAIRNKFDPYEQIKNRLKQLKATGHPTDKCELIIMGGTFLSTPKEFQDNFVKRCLDAFNEKASRGLSKAQKLNEKAKHRCVGLTIETRADYCKKEHIEQMLKLGCTRVEIGLQSTDDKILKKIRRGHGTKENIEAIKLLKEAGLKVCAHFMPGLTGLNKLDIKKELLLFKELFKNPDYRPDELKIYPCLVIKGTELYELWKKKKYQPLNKEQMVLLLKKIKKAVPRYVRIKRIMRDISEKEVVAGPGITNLRQLAAAQCNCIRCREVKNKIPEKVTMQKIVYTASGGKEIFLSYEDRKNDLLLGFLRLRIDNDAKVRELHVYGPSAEIGKKGKIQHKGYGKKLLKESEKIAKKEGKKEIYVTSGIGVREYYRKLGYMQKGFYMVKKL